MATDTTDTGASWTRAVFAEDVLSGIGAPQTPENISFLLSWMQHEHGVEDTRPQAANNPLNTSQAAPFASNFNDVPVRNYIDPAEGAIATVQTLKNGLYGRIVTALKSGKPSAYQSDPEFSSELHTWSGASGYTSIAGFAPNDAPLSSVNAPSYDRTSQAESNTFSSWAFGSSTGGPYTDWVNKNLGVKPDSESVLSDLGLAALPILSEWPLLGVAGAGDAGAGAGAGDAAAGGAGGAAAKKVAGAAGSDLAKAGAGALGLSALSADTLAKGAVIVGAGLLIVLGVARIGGYGGKGGSS